jgi:hypothetical protein
LDLLEEGKFGPYSSSCPGMPEPLDESYIFPFAQKMILAEMNPKPARTGPGFDLRQV